ncbi:probable carboxylesterase 2 [Hordeum vulgare subsp. vulgare]|uniref:Alpha/beta hydrolase fold-3 domain-containing protein n=1 Tax=Hordeum vulgare subsp. vulgare TaxID=112509 RepID=A0A8I6Y4B6_HORVV|nr:probable carboxylesterase 2 [Hordeum vulgare subsp. vulgare]
MDPESEVTFEFVPVIRQYRSGRVERLLPVDPVPPSVHAVTGVASRDVVFDPATGTWARLYLPACHPDGDRLPVMVYLHGGGLVAGSAADAPEHAFLNRLCARARAVGVSVEYRLAPEHPVPACYDDAWAALRWAAEGADPWLRDLGDRGRMFVVGYSAGGNVAHHVALRAGSEADALPRGARVRGLGLLHPYFLSAKKSADGERSSWLRGKLEELWAFACGGRTAGLDDPRINPVADGAPSLRRLGCDRVLVCLAEDELRLRGKAYHDGLLGSGWAEGDADLFDSVGEDHQFFLREPPSATALVLMDRLVALLGAGVNQQ